MAQGQVDTAADEDCVTVTCTVRNARRVDSKTLFALVDVEMLIGGVAMVICGVQARHIVPGGGTAIHLPTYKGTDGIWRSAIELPDDLRAPMAQAVLAFLVEEGLAKDRYDSARGAKTSSQ